MTWNDLISRADFVGAAFGAFLGFLLALIVLLIERLINWFQQRADKKQLFKDILAIIEKECAGARDAADHYEELAKRYTDKPHDMQPRPIHINVGLRTLDRMDRQVMLAALRRVAGRSKGWELWRELLRFVDGLGAHYPFQETAILSSMEDMNEVEQAFDKHTRQVHFWAMTIGSEARRLGLQPMVTSIDGVLAKVQNIGMVPMTHLHDLLVVPIGELFKVGTLNLQNALPLAEEHTKARAAFARRAEITKELSSNLRIFATSLDGIARDGECLRDRMKDALK